MNKNSLSSHSRPRQITNWPGEVSHAWSDSKAYRVALGVVLVCLLVRLFIQAAYLSGEFVPDEEKRPDGTFVPNDLENYLVVADRLQQRQDLYQHGKIDDIDHIYQYAPSFALAYTPFLLLHPLAVVVIHTLLNIIGYGLLYIYWRRIFHQLGFQSAERLMVGLLPVWLIFSGFWGDLALLNVYILMALIGTLFIESILNQRLGWALLWLSVILQTKPQWAFAAALPLLLGQYRFFLKLVALALLTYAAIVLATLLAAGSTYGWQQYIDYYNFLLNLSANFPWRGFSDGFLGYNHSIKQIILYFLGDSPLTESLATIVKSLLLVPLAAVSFRHFLYWRRFNPAAPRTQLDLAFALYLGAFIGLDTVWELSLGIVLFIYLIATLERPAERRLVWIVFLPYALRDFWQAASVLAAFIFDFEALSGGYVLTDPNIYFPVVMAVILIFYILLIRRLWPLPAAQAPGPAYQG